ncbi:MAG: hypothetical protein K0R24_2107, partial [Gammaproteobacteria bacterium]|nr:hypothetical protein [Gammaproteobacteria bacterium]
TFKLIFKPYEEVNDIDQNEITIAKTEMFSDTDGVQSVIVGLGYKQLKINAGMLLLRLQNDLEQELEDKVME